MENRYNIRSPAVKRLMREAEELHEPTEEYYAQPLEDNLFEWHFTVRGPPDSDFDSGFYHGRIILPTEYPMKPPSIILLTPNGRFEINKKICLSISGHHPESWQPSWSIRTALLAIIGFMPTEGMGAIGSLDYPKDERKTLAMKSQSWRCETCGEINRLLKDLKEGETESEESKEARELAKQICFKAGNENENKVRTQKVKKNEGTDRVPSSRNVSVNNSSFENQNTGIRQRHVESTNERTVQEGTTNVNLNSSNSRITFYLIIFLVTAIGFLLFRRLFLQ